MKRLLDFLLRRCPHDFRGVANYYDRDAKAFLHLVECRDCGVVLIERREA